MSKDSSDDFPQFERSSLLVHIAFHHVAARLPYLERVVRTIESYPFRRIQVVIDTNLNDSDFDSFLGPGSPRCSVRRHVHSDLDDPFHLTWQHRRHIEENVEVFDYFMYVEDDVMVPGAALERWRIDEQRLEPHSYQRGFLRVESVDGREIRCTDQKRPASSHRLVRIGSTVYLSPVNPYCGFWIHSRMQVRRFMTMACWNPRHNREFKTREAAACGMIQRRRGDHRVLIPMHPSGQVLAEALVWHLPANYARDPDSRFGSLAIGEVLRRDGVGDSVMAAVHGALRRLGLVRS